MKIANIAQKIVIFEDIARLGLSRYLSQILLELCTVKETITNRTHLNSQSIEIIESLGYVSNVVC